MRPALFARPSTPGESRGVALAAIAGAYGVARGVYGAIAGNQQKQRNKGYIGRAYRSASIKLDTRQADAGQSNAESLNARGLATGGVSAVRAAMNDGKVVSQGPGATTLGQQSGTDIGKEFALEREDLEAAKTKALNENQADYGNAVAGSIAGGAQGAASVYSSGQELSAMKGGSAAPSATRQAYMSGIDDPANAWGGIHPVDPLNAPGSSWNDGTTIGDGQPNYSFNGRNG